MDNTCVHSCKGLCSALSVAENQEKQSIAEYKRFAASCDYPDVRELIDSILKDRERALAALRDKREQISTRFGVVDDINDNFA